MRRAEDEVCGYWFSDADLQEVSEMVDRADLGRAPRGGAAVERPEMSREQDSE